MTRFTVIDAAQRTHEWFSARAGRATGSKAKDILAKIKSGEAAARRDYRTQLVVERLTGEPLINDFTNADMQRGIDLEPAARGEYEAHTGCLARETGFLAMAEHMAGCSLDGDVNDFEGILELKVPKSATHVRYLQERRLPPEHLPQIVHNMWVTGAKFCDFCSYDDRLPVGLRFFHVRVEACELVHEMASYETEVLRFLAEVDSEHAALLKLRAAA